MDDDVKYFEVISTNESGEAVGRLDATKTRSGVVVIGVEEWLDDSSPFESELEETAISLSPSQFRAFIKWGKEVCG